MQEGPAPLTRRRAVHVAGVLEQLGGHPQRADGGALLQLEGHLGDLGQRRGECFVAQKRCLQSQLEQWVDSLTVNRGVTNPKELGWYSYRAPPHLVEVAVGLLQGGALGGDVPGAVVLGGVGAGACWFWALGPLFRERPLAAGL